MAAAAMQDLHGYVISDEDTFMPPRDSRRGSSTIGDDDERGSRQGSIDEQIDILSSMDDVNEEEYRSVSASPAPRQDERKRDTSAPSRASWLQPTVEDHEDTPPPLSNRPSPRGGGGARAPEVRIEDYEDHLRKMNEAARKSAALDVRDSASDSRTTPSSSKNDADADTDADPDDLRAQLNRLRNELARQKDDSASRISNLEQQLHRAHAERDEARSNEQRRVRDLTARHDERARDLDDHWQRRLAAQQARAEHDAQEQASAFALVRSSFDARLAASETALLARLAQKDAELDTARTAHAQELEQLRAGHDARVASLEARVGDLQAARADRRSGGGDDQHLGGRDSSLPVTVEQTLAQQKADARIAELEARLAAAQAHLEAARAEQSLSSSFSYSDAGKGLGGRVGGNSTKHHHQAEDELLERSRRQVEDLETSLELLREQLGFARRETEGLRRDADAARESARVLRDELREAQARAAEGERRAGGLERAREEDGEMAEAARRDVVRMLENARREADAERARARELEKLVERMKGEKDGVRKRAEEAVRVAGTRLNGERIEKAGLKRALEGLKAEVEELRGTVEARKKGFEDVEGREGGAAFERMGNEHTDTFSSPDSRSSELESLRRALREAGLAAKDAQADARKARAEMAALKEDFESVNRAMDERVVQLLRTREKEWRQKVEALEKEKKALGRALLHEWGREEVGECEPQAYRYKFVKKGGAGEKGKV
ncbi:hypothetical protein B0J12DRAFT_673726 [Macrophomina phaseolina]|uniref:Spindle assembly checkpoint component MAD1 n=1 Tax=Macrophomina phaseolina TaxID=35725 RepID=A0ABQ8G541_9PEZI|nr:hypothetical protein B0J12DRAFT_673726 [Macrophomina phaseolina]